MHRRVPWGDIESSDGASPRGKLAHRHSGQLTNVLSAASHGVGLKPGSIIARHNSHFASDSNPEAIFLDPPVLF